MAYKQKNNPNTIGKQTMPDYIKEGFHFLTGVSPKERQARKAARKADRQDNREERQANREERKMQREIDKHSRKIDRKRKRHARREGIGKQTPIWPKPAGKQTQEEWDSYSDKKKKRLMEKGVKKETKAHEKYHGKPGKEGKGERIESKLKSAKKPGGTTTLGRVKYKRLVNKLDKIYKGMYPGESVNLGFGPWKPSKK